jgi:hypothetical protein
VLDPDEGHELYLRQFRPLPPEPLRLAKRCAGTNLHPLVFPAWVKAAAVVVGVALFVLHLVPLPGAAETTQTSITSEDRPDEQTSSRGTILPEESTGTTFLRNSALQLSTSLCQG